MKNRQTEIRVKALKLLEIKAKISKLYEQRDKVEKDLRGLIEVGEEFPLGEDQVVVHINNFTEKNVVFGHGPVKLYEIIIKKRKTT